jgi:hypothetical protein
MADNHRLCQYYQRLGFDERGVTGNDRWSARLFQRPAGLDREPAR